MLSSSCEFDTAVDNSPPFWNESPFQTFTPKFQPEFLIDSFDELSEMEIRSKRGASCRRLVWHAHLHAIIILWSSIDTSSCYHHLVSWTCTPPCYHHLVSWTCTSSCYHHLVVSIDASSCYHHLGSSTDTSSCYHHDIIILWLEVYGLQTKILLEWWTKDERRILETLFKGVSTRCGLRASEITVQISRNHHFIFCSFFPNYAPKRRFCTLFNTAGDSLAASTLFNTASVHAL
jgi:hypothetical protein